MKLATITFQRSVSFGAFLQTYALATVLNKMGHQVQVIDYTPPHRETLAFPWSKRFGGLNPKNLYNLWNRRKFTRAIESHLPLTAKHYRTLEDLRADPPPADAYICGSDQIWNANHTGGQSDPAYFCDFGSPGVRRIAYAPSIGTPNFPEEHRAAFIENLKHLDCLSTREQSGAEMVTKFSGRPCTHVLDPTLLLDSQDYAPLYPPNALIPNPYILVFSLNNVPLFFKTLDAIETSCSVPFVSVATQGWWWRHRGTCRYCSPADWLNLYAGASGVVTNSFHGTAFAILFKKPFFIVSRTGDTYALSTRMVELLETLGLMDRYIRDDSDLSKLRPITEKPNWSEAHNQLHNMRQRSFDYLQECLRMRDGLNKRSLTTRCPSAPQIEQ